MGKSIVPDHCIQIEIKYFWDNNLMYDVTMPSRLW